MINVLFINCSLDNYRMEHCGRSCSRIVEQLSGFISGMVLFVKFKKIYTHTLTGFRHLDQMTWSQVIWSTALAAKLVVVVSRRRWSCYFEQWIVYMIDWDRTLVPVDGFVPLFLMWMVSLIFLVNIFESLSMMLAPSRWRDFLAQHGLWTPIYGI